MHCPRCGTSATVGQQFCRSCGFNLEKVSELFGDPLAAEPSHPGSEAARLRERQQKVERWVRIAGLSVVELILVTLILVAILQMILTGSFGVLELFLVLILIATAVMIGLKTYARLLKEKLENPPLPRPTGRLQSDEVRSLEAFREPVSTITDRTTELLSPPNGVDTGKLHD